MTESVMSVSADLERRARQRLHGVERWHQIGAFGCFDQRFTIRTTDPYLSEFLADLYRSMSVDTGGDDVAYTLLPACGDDPGLVSRDDEKVVVSRRPDRLLGTLIWAVNRQVIERSLDRLVLHAAAAEQHGATVVMPAPMESGKTTLVTGLLDRGLRYLTDEAVALSEDLTVEGYPKPLSLDPGSWELLSHHQPPVSEELRPYLRRQWQVAPHSVAPVTRRSRVALLVFPRYEEGTALRLEPLSPASMVSESLGCVFAPEGESVPLERVRMMARVAERVPAYRLVHGDLDAACRVVIELLNRHGET